MTVVNDNVGFGLYCDDDDNDVYDGDDDHDYDDYNGDDDYDGDDELG